MVWLGLVAKSVLSSRSTFLYGREPHKNSTLLLYYQTDKYIYIGAIFVPWQSYQLHNLQQINTYHSS